MLIQGSKNNRYYVDGHPFSGPEEVGGAVSVRKRPLTVTACRLDIPFAVETSEGLMQGKPGDWLIKGVEGELYICPHSIFEASYDIVE